MENILFLPGLGCDERLFYQQIHALKNEFDINTIICNTQNNMQSHIEYVLKQSPDKFILIGHSFGGWIAQWIAIHFPKRVSKLILMGTGTGKLTPELKSIFENMLQHFENNKAMEFFDEIRSLTLFHQRKNDIELIKAMQIDFPLSGLLNQVKTDLEGKDTSNDLDKITCRTLLIHGKHDPFYADEMKILKAKISNSDYIEIEECGHMIPIEQPEVVTVEIKKWLCAT